MTDRPDEQAEVRRLLAEARHTEPIPDDVASRMDDVLAGLASRAPEPTVVSLAAHRRRRIAGGLVAAAAVVVGAVLVAPHLSSPSSSSASETAGGVAVPSQQAGSQYSGQDTEKAPGPEKNLPHANASSPLTRDGRVLVRPGHFSADARAVQLRVQRASAPVFDSLKAVGCGDVPRGVESLAAVYRHAPAALVFRKPRGGSQLVELYACGTARPLRSATLPAP